MTHHLTWDSVAQLLDCRVRHVSSRADEMRVVCECRGESIPGFVIVLRGINRYFDKGVANSGPVKISLTDEPGSFGWDMSPTVRTNFKELHINSRTDTLNNLFRAIAASIALRASNGDEDINCPG